MKARLPAVGAMAAAALLVVLTGCGPSSGPHGTPTPTPIPLGPLPAKIALPSGSAAPFAISGNVLTWSGIPNPTGACPRNKVYLANVRAYRPRVIWSAGQCDVVSDIHISPTWIAWSAGVSPGGSIWGHNRATGKTFHIAGQPQPSPADTPCAALGCFPNISFNLSNNIAVWSQTEFSTAGDLLTSSILGKILPSGRPRVLYSTTLSCTLEIQPFLHAGRLVWLQQTWPRDVAVSAGVRRCEGTPLTNVMTERIRSALAPGRHAGYPSLATEITSSGLASSPQTDGRFVTWLDTLGVSPTCVCSDLDLFDTVTDSVLTVAHGVTNGNGYIGYVLSGHLLSWLQLFPHSQRLQVAMVGPRRLHLSRIHTLAISGPAASSRFIRTYGWPSNRRLVWELDTLTKGSPAVAVTIRDVK